jgi:uncharacterized protein (UPF0332 family)
MNFNSEDYIKYRLQKAKETLEEVNSHIENQFWSTALNRMYYACFYAVSALLFSRGLKATTHSGVRHQFGQNFVLTKIIPFNLGKHYSKLFEKRQKSDYDDFIEITYEMVKDLYPASEDLINTIEKLLFEQKDDNF